MGGFRTSSSASASGIHLCLFVSVMEALIEPENLVCAYLCSQTVGVCVCAWEGCSRNVFIKYTHTRTHGNGAYHSTAAATELARSVCV